MVASRQVKDAAERGVGLDKLLLSQSFDHVIS